MTAASDAIFRKATFAFCGDAPQVIGGTPYMMDRSANGLHATLINFAAPNYGFGRDTRGRGYYDFTFGASRRATLPMTFYDSAPTGAWTMVLGCRFTTATAACRIFTAKGSAPNRGMRVEWGADNRLNWYHYDTGAVWNYGLDPAGYNYIGRYSVEVMIVDGPSSRSPECRDTFPVTTTGAWSTNPILYDTSIVPTIFSVEGGGTYASGDLGHLSLWPWAFNATEAVDITRLILDGVL